MAKLYNKTRVAVNKTSVGDDVADSFKYKGFSSKENKNGYKLYDLDLVKQDIINHFYIRKGEKLMNPNFGTVIWDMIFEPFTEEAKEIIAKDVQDVINYDPRIVVNQVSVDTTEMGIRIEADITYIPFNVNERMRFDFDKNSQRIN
jgi:phage baseplate assembly protein W